MIGALFSVYCYSNSPGCLRIVARYFAVVCYDPTVQWMVVLCLVFYFIMLLSVELRALSGAPNCPLRNCNVWLGVFVLLAMLRYTFAYDVASQSTRLLIFLTGIVFGKAVSTWAMDVQIYTGKAPVGNGRGCYVAVPLCGAGPIEMITVPLLSLLTGVTLWKPEMILFQYRGISRWSGIWDNPNTFGLLMGAGVVLAASQIVVTRRSKTEHREWINTFGVIMFSFAAVVCVCGLVKSYSRGAWVGTAIGLLYLAKAYGKFKWRWVLPPVFVALVAVCYFWNNTPEDSPWLVKRLDLGRASAQHRVAAWKAGFEMMREHPFGVGWNKTVPTYAQNYSPPEGGASAITTNDYLMLGTQIGIPALLCFIAYVALQLGIGERIWKKAESGKRKAEMISPHPDPLPSLQARRGDNCISPGTHSSPGFVSPVTRHLSPEASLRVACRAGALVFLVAFWFDGGLFKLATASVFWILLELGAETGLAAKRHKRHKEGEENWGTDTTSPHPGPLPSCEERRGICFRLLNALRQ